MIDETTETPKTEETGGSAPETSTEPVTSTPETAQNDGFWAKLSPAKKRNYQIGGVALLLLLVVIWRFASHKTAAAPTPTAAAKPAAAVTAPDITAAEQTAMKTPTAANFINLSLAYYQSNRFVDCILASRRALSISPNEATAYNNIGASFNHINAFDSAIAACKMALKISPNFDLAKGNLAEAQKEKQKQQENIDQLKKATSDAPTADNYMALAQGYYQAWQFTNAIGAAKSAIGLKPQNAPAFNLICASDNHLGKFAEGKKAVEKSLKIDPSNQLAKNNLKWSEEGIAKDSSDKARAKAK